MTAMRSGRGAAQKCAHAQRARLRQRATSRLSEPQFRRRRLRRGGTPVADNADIAIMRALCPSAPGRASGGGVISMKPHDLLELRPEDGAGASGAADMIWD